MFKTSVLLTCLASAYATNAGNTRKNADYDKYSSTAVDVPYGYYTITNVGSGQSLTYAANNGGRNLFPADGLGTLLELQPHNASTPWVRMRAHTTTKCVSAQWNYEYCNGSGCDWAGVLYQCAVDPDTDATLETTKQFWLFQALGTSPESYNIITLDHLHDMPTRALYNGVQVTGGNVKSIRLEQLDQSDLRFAWYVTKNGAGTSLPAQTSRSIAPDDDSPPPTTTTRATSAPQQTCGRATTVTRTRTITQAARTVTKTRTVTQTKRVKRTNGKFIDWGSLSPEEEDELVARDETSDSSSWTWHKAIRPGAYYV